MVKIIPPEGLSASKSLSSLIVSACFGASPNNSPESLNTPKSCPSKSCLSVTITIVGLPSLGSEINLPARQVISILLPAPCVCQTTPPFLLPSTCDASTTFSSAFWTA